MGKDQELVQAVKAEDVAAVQKLLQRPKPGKASECRGGGARPGRGRRWWSRGEVLGVGGAHTHTPRTPRHRGGSGARIPPAAPGARPGCRPSPCPAPEHPRPFPGAARRGRVGAVDVPGTPGVAPGRGAVWWGAEGRGGGKRSGGGASPGRCAGARRCTASPRRSRCKPRCGRAPAGLPLPCAREKLPSPWGARAGPVQLVGGVVGGLGLGTGTGEGRGLQAGRQGRAGGTRLRLSVRGACVCTDRACVRRRLPVPARICMCRCACTCVLGVHVCLCLGACLCLCIGVYPGICVFGCGCVGVSPCGGVWM